MTIGIDASRAFTKNKTGIEEYSFQVIKHLRTYLRDHEVILYLDSRVNKLEYVDFELPPNWNTKFLRAPKFWTQFRLSLEMLLHPVDVLFVPAHTVPLIHPRNTVVTIHGLEYEFCPKAYSFWQRIYMRWSIKNSCRWSRKIIAVSKNTKRDLMRSYKVPENKIEVVYEGCSNDKSQFPNSNFQQKPKNLIQNAIYQILNTEYLFYVGRLEERKNLIRVVEAFEKIKKENSVKHKLVLAGKFGYGGEKIKNKIEKSEYKDDIILTGYVSDEEKWELMKRADVFLFPTLYEGFGLPILEAQSAGTSVVTSNISSMPEVAGNSAILVDPKSKDAIAEGIHRLISDEVFRSDIIEKGYENLKRFSWEKCANDISIILNQ